MSTDKWAMMSAEGSDVSARRDSTTKSRTLPFDPSSLSFDYKTHTAVEVQPSDPLFALVTAHLCKPGVIVEEDAISFQMARAEKSGQGKQRCCGGRVSAAACDPEPSLSNVSTSLGIGIFRFTHKGVQLKALHQHIGDPVGTGCGVSVMNSLVLFCEGQGLESARAVQAFLSEILAESEKSAKNTFQVYRWHVKYHFWQRVSRVVARPVSSVVLPMDTSEMLVKDLSEFLSEETAQFYNDHGIPYKRSYLFHGAPGSGKTSMIQALAGAFGRNLCYLSPTHPELDDDSLKSAIEKVPDNAIIILEDVDALFGKRREKKVHSSPLTFSGLLNALDGVGNHNGMVFVLTTNFKDQLDSALIRDGRVDVRIHFDYCTPEQMEKMFDKFYPDSSIAGGSDTTIAPKDVDPEIAALEAKLAALKKAKALEGVAQTSEKVPTGADFRDALLVTLGERKVSAAQLQSFFVTHRKCLAAEVLAKVGAIAAAIDQREKDEADKEAGKEASGESQGNGDGQKAAQKEEANGNIAERPGSDSRAVHVHIHTDGK